MKRLLGGILGVLLIAVLVMGVMALVVLANAGILHLLGVQYASFGWLVGYVLIAAIVGLPLELITNSLAKALFETGRANRLQANFLYIPLDALCSAFVFWVIDVLMPQIEANGFALIVSGLITAMFSLPIEKTRAQNSQGNQNNSAKSD